MNGCLEKKLLMAGTLLWLSLSTIVAQSAIISTGDVSPADPASWDSTTLAYVGNTSNGALTINGDSDLGSNQLYVGYGAGVTGEIIVEGIGSTMKNSSRIYVGEFGSGLLNITEGGTVDSYGGFIGANTGSSGIVTVNGIGSSWTNAAVYVGVSGTGTLNITGGAVVSGNGKISCDRDSKGTVTVEGAGSKWISPSIQIGRHGNGALNIGDGGTVESNSNSIIGGDDSDATGVVTVDGIGSIWSNKSGLTVGGQGSAILNITGGGTVISGNLSFIAGLNGGMSAVTVDGNGSTWSNKTGLYVGYYGTGILNISGGATVTVGDITELGVYPTNRGTIHFGEGGGTLTTKSLRAPASQLTGTGTINTHGISSDVDLVFDSTHDITQTFLINNVTVHLSQDSSGILGVGHSSNGSLVIRDGKKISAAEGIIGVWSGSTGIVAVEGAGSTWINGYYLVVGYGGNGTLKISDGGVVSARYTDIGCSTGIVTVGGIGSLLINSGSLDIGIPGNGTLNIVDGGAVTAYSVAINNKSLLAIDIGKGSKLTAKDGTGTITNNGKIRILAGIGSAAYATHNPISAAWNTSGTGTVQAVGGKWNSTSHEFTVSDIQPGMSGVGVVIDRKDVQRVLIDDGASGWKLGTSVAATDASAPLTLTATAISAGTLDKLNGMLLADEKLLGGWDLTADGGYTAGEPLYLSFGNGTGRSFTSEEMKVWSFDGTKWAELAVSDLTFDGSYANFTATKLGCYAVSVPVPEPAAMVMLMCGMVAIGVARWRGVA